jgi:tRNA(Ile)-lysidine synthase
VKLTSIQARVSRAVRRLGLPAPGDTVVVGLSGGPDSVALLDALAWLAPRAGFSLAAAHLDHGLRPESAADAEFCRALAGRMGVPFHVGRADVRARAAREGGGLEQAGRLERYAFLRRVREEAGASCVAVAHTRDDQAETLLLNLLRGAGGRGLGAMRPRAGDVVRPLLEATRAEVMEHLGGRALPFRQDGSNADPALLRNRVRHELIPFLEARFQPAVRAVLARTAGLLAEDADWLHAEGERLAAGAARGNGGGVALSRRELRALPRAAARSVVRLALEPLFGGRPPAAAHVDGVLDLALSPQPSGRSLSLPGGMRASAAFGEVVLGPAPEPSLAGFARELPVPGRVELPDGRAIVAEAVPGPAAAGVGAAVVAAGGPLVVRGRRPGDRVPLARGRRRLKRLLLERRVPREGRERMPVVAAGPDVVWVPGEASLAAAGGAGPWVRLRLEARAREA